MKIALKEAFKAKKQGEVPIGAVLVKGERILSIAYNKVIKHCDPTAHAEMLALREAAKIIGNYRLLETELYVTVEPCLMCTGAIIQARIKRLVFGAFEPKMGAFGSYFDVKKVFKLNQLEIKGNVLAEEAQALMQAFFRQRRGTEAAVTGATRNRFVL